MPGAALQISAYRHSPAGMSGVETISHELADQAEEHDMAIDHVFAPAGGGGLALATALGFERRAAAGRLPKSPAVHVVQPVGNDTIATPLSQGATRAREVACSSRISGLQVPTVIDGDGAIAACRATGGRGFVVEDEAIHAAQRALAEREGVFCEPAAAASLAGALRAAREGALAADAVVVCLVTGSGFKDAASIQAMNRGRSVPTIEVEDMAGAM
jgi:threonine synthase